MADGERDEDWGPKIARWTFVLTVISALLFVGSVIAFVLTRKV